MKSAIREDELYHYGRIGMKWGQHIFGGKKPTTGNRRKTEDYHEDYKRAHNGKSISQMSDQELRTVLNRLQMEKQYQSFDAKSVKIGKRYVSKITKTIGRVTNSTDAVLKLYNNANRIKKIING